MKKILFSLVLLTNFSFTNSENTELTIEVVGLDSAKKGNLRIGIFKKEGFLKPDKAVDGKIVPVTSSTMKVMFKNLPSGTYGVAVVQDQDKNGKLSTNIVGYPTEPYGFSNNKYGNLGPPSFSDAAIKLEEGKTTEIKIKLK
jgi:uncharacterized protein (DUF2141 family)